MCININTSLFKFCRFATWNVRVRSRLQNVFVCLLIKLVESSLVKGFVPNVPPCFELVRMWVDDIEVVNSAATSQTPRNHCLYYSGVVRLHAEVKAGRILSACRSIVPKSSKLKSPWKQTRGDNKCHLTCSFRQQFYCLRFRTKDTDVTQY